MDTSNEKFGALLKSKILNFLSSKPASFEKIVDECNGPLPTEVKALLSELVIDRQIVFKRNKYKLSDPTLFFPTEDGANNNSSKFLKLSDPHPTDYDWRFDAKTLKRLKDKVDLYTGGDLNETVYLLGTTTLFQVVRESYPNTKLINKSKSQLEDLKNAGYSYELIEHDLFAPIPAGLELGRVIVADPPWYPEYYEAFILGASQLLQLHGVMLVSVMSENIRPSAKDDIRQIRNFAESCGFALRDLENNFFRYVSPKFERKTFALQNIRVGNWRRGNLFVFVKEQDIYPNIQLRKPKDEFVWNEFKIGTKVIKVKASNFVASSRFHIRTSDEQPVLSSVSRRFDKRQSIDFWTSDNVAFEVSRPDIIVAAMKLYCENQMSYPDLLNSIGSNYKLDENELKDLKNLFSFVI